MRNPALDAWGDYDRDDPYPLFAQVRADGPAHEVTLADGHRAWLIVRHEEAKAALNHAALSKDMHAALARDGAVVAERSEERRVGKECRSGVYVYHQKRKPD